MKDRLVRAGESYAYYSQQILRMLENIQLAALQLTHFIGGFNIDRQHAPTVNVNNNNNNTPPPPPIRVLKPDIQQAALTGILRVLTDDDADDGEKKKAKLFPQIGIDTSYLAVNTGESIQALDLKGSIFAIRAATLNALTERARLENLMYGNEWLLAVKEAGFGPQDIFTQMTDALFVGKPWATSARLADSNNWDIQMYWIETLGKIASSCSTSSSSSCLSSVPILATTHLSLIQEEVNGALKDGATVPKTAKPYPLLKAISIKLENLLSSS